MAERDDLLPPRVRLREGHGGLVGLRAARAEEGPLEPARRQLHELLGELGDRQGRVEGRDVPEPIHLRAHRRVHARVRVADADRQDAAEEIEVLAAVEVAHARTGAALERQRLGVVGRVAREEVLLELRADRSAARLVVGHRGFGYHLLASQFDSQPRSAGFDRSKPLRGG